MRKTIVAFLSVILAVFMLASTMPVGAVVDESGATSVVLEKPRAVNITANTSAIRITWLSVKNATGYRVYSLLNGKWKTVLSSTEDTTHTFSKLPAGKTYTLALRAYRVVGRKVYWASESTVFTASTAPVLGKTSKITYDSNSSAIKLNWAAVKNASGYGIYNYANGKWSLAAKTDKITHTFTGLAASKNFTVAVRAYSVVNGKIVWASGYTTAKVSTKAPVLGAPAVKASTTISSISLSWNKVPYAMGYRIYYKVNGGWKTCATTTKTSHSFTGLPANKSYTIAVRAYRQANGKVTWASKYTIINVHTVNSSYSKAEIANMYNKAVNNFKAYKGNAVVEEIKIIDAEVRSLPTAAANLINSVVDEYTGTTTTDYYFMNGKNTDGRTPNDVIAPWGKAAKLTAAAIESATYAANKNGGYTITVKLIDENIIFDGVTNVRKASAHEAILDPLDFSVIDFSPVEISSATTELNETVVTICVDAKGRLTKFSYDMPATAKPTVKVGNLAFTFDAKVEMSALLEITYS